MKHLGVRIDTKIELKPEYEGKFRLKRTVECSKCKEISYALYSPELEQEPAIVEKHAHWLSTHVASRCPHHVSPIYTPDLL